MSVWRAPASACRLKIRGKRWEWSKHNMLHINVIVIILLFYCGGLTASHWCRRILISARSSSPCAWPTRFTPSCTPPPRPVLFVTVPVVVAHFSKLSLNAAAYERSWYFDRQQFPSGSFEHRAARCFFTANCGSSVKPQNDVQLIQSQ